MQEKIVYLMRGLPSCGKSHTARRLAGDGGVVLETDEYFYVIAGDDPAHYDYSEKLLPKARQWNFERFRRALAQQISPIVVDRGNGLNRETQRYARLAADHEYRVELREPESPWWQELRVLLKYKHVTGEILDQWAEQLAEMSRATHRVPASTIRSWMKSWKHDLSVDEILHYQQPPSPPGA
jgi:hypothetical protein